MHQTRQQTLSKIPIARKGTKYIARAASHNKVAVPVVIAVRDMLHLARTMREVKEMIHQKLLQMNGRAVKDVHESIKLYNTLKVDKTYRLILSPTGKFSFEEVPSNSPRVCKIVNQRLAKNNLFQVSLHDGTNIISKESLPIGGSLYLDMENKVKKHVSLAQGKEISVISGKFAGSKGTIESIEGSKVKVKLTGGVTQLEKASVLAL